MLRRKIAAELERWLKSSEQKALFITGSRQMPLYATWALSDVLGDSCAEGIKLEVKPV